MRSGRPTGLALLQQMLRHQRQPGRQMIERAINEYLQRDITNAVNAQLP
jgi:hypothetical protein